MIAIALLGAVGTGFLVSEGGGRASELALATAAVVAAYLVGLRAGQLLAAASILAYLALELHHGRLDGAHYWQQALFSTGIGAAVLSSAYLRAAIERRRQGLLEAHAEIEVLRDGAVAGGVGARMLPPLDYELERARRHNHRVSLLVVRPDDADDLELRHGEEGVRALVQRVAEVLARQLRATDVPLREGRLEHWAILPETAAADARVVAERIRLAVGSQSLEFGPGEIVDLAVSIGAAAFPDDGTSNDEVVRAARDAHAHAVALGGNRSVMSSLPEPAPRGWVIDEAATAPSG